MTKSANRDKEFMLEALALARMGWGLTTPNPMVGAVIVRDGEIIGRGYHSKAGEAHAEINALSDAVRHGHDCTGSTMYVTLEPCCTFGKTPPCTDAIKKAKISRVVIGVTDPNPVHSGKGVEILRQSGIEVAVGVEKNACTEINQHFFKWIVTGKPFVILKMAMTLDGKIATQDGDSKWITGVEARSRVQKLRRLADAIMVGGETVRLDRPFLNVREPEDWPCQPLRLIATRTMADEELSEFFPDKNFEKVDLNCTEDWEKLLRDLGKRRILTLLIEGGGELAASAINANAVDMIEFHIAPKLLGGRDSRPVLGGLNPDAMIYANMLSRVKVTNYGDDIAVTGYLKG